MFEAPRSSPDPEQDPLSPQVAHLETLLNRIKKLADSDRFKQEQQKIQEELNVEIAAFVTELLTTSEQLGFRVTPAQPPWHLARREEDEDLLVRNENPERILEALFNEQSITIKPSRDHNACLPSNEGIEAAFSWGHHGKGIRMVYGFDRNHVQQREIQQHPTDVRHIEDAVSIEGKVESADIRFVIVRAPRHAFPENLLTEKEMDDLEPTEMVYRVIAPKQRERKTAPE